MLKIISMLGLVVMIAALVGLYKIGVLFTAQPIAIALQLIAVALMIWARITFGRRSFHAAANPTAGGLCEEHLVKQTYPEYVEYAKVTKRMVPYLF